MIRDPSYDFISAVRRGNVAKVKELMATYSLSQYAAWSDGYNLLRDALQERHPKIVKMLLESGCKVNSKKKRSTNTPLHFAVRNKDTAIVSMLLERGANVDAKNNSGDTPLHFAVKSSNRTNVALLLDKKAKVDALNNSGVSSLHLAIIGGNAKMTELLLKYTLHINKKLCHGINILHAAAESGNPRIVEQLLNRGAPIEIESRLFRKEGYTPLHCAAASGNAEAVQLLLARGADINARTDVKSTPLHLAAKMGRVDVVKVLLEHADVDIRAKDDDGKTLLSIAIAQAHLPMIKKIFEIRPDAGNETDQHYLRELLYNHSSVRCDSPIMEVLLSHGFSVYPEDAKDRKLLHIVVEKGSTKVLQALLQNGADVDSLHVERNGFTLLHTAACNGQHDVAKMLIEHGADVNAADGNNEFPVTHAVKNIDARMTKLLVSNGAKIKFNPGIFIVGVSGEVREIFEIMMNNDPDFDINARHQNRGTILDYIISQKIYSLGFPDRLYKSRTERDHSQITLELTELFLSRGADIHSSDKDGRTFLHNVVEGNLSDIVEITLKYKPNVNAVENVNMKTPLHVSATVINEKMTRMLLNAGARVDVKDKNGQTPLHIACAGHDGKVVDALLQFGASIDDRDNDDFSPLHVAAVNGSLEATETLLSASASIEFKDKDGRTALYAAARLGHAEVVEELLNYGADVNVTCNNGRTPLDCATLATNPRPYNRDDIYNIYYQREFDYDFDDDYGYRYDCDDFSDFGNDDYYDYLDDDSSINSDCYPNETAEVIKQHIVKLKSLNLYVSRRNLDAVDFDNELSDYRDDCAIEARFLRDSKIGDTNISYYDVLVKSNNQLAILARNKCVVDALQSAWCEERCSIFYRMLCCNLEKGQKREKLLSSSLKSLDFLSGFALPELVSLEIMNELSNRDLENLIKAGPENDHRLTAGNTDTT